MGNPETEMSRQARLEEIRQQRRSVMLTTIGALVITVVVVGVALTRFTDDSGTAKIRLLPNTSTRPTGGVLGFSSSSIPDTTTPTAEPTTTSIVETTTTAPPTTTTTKPAPTTTTAPPPTTTTIAKKPNIVWSASPASIRVQSGGQATVSVTATNSGTGPGPVTAPSCPGHPSSFAAFASVCAQGNQIVTLNPGQSQTWPGFTIVATTDGTRQGASLKPGRYFVTIGGVFVVVNVTA